MFGSGRKKTCGATSSAPFRASCTRESGHAGQHSARGLRWGADGKIKFGRGRGGKK